MMERISFLADELGQAILPGANVPFNRIDNTPWVPKPRGALMRDYFDRIGDSAAYGPRVMALTLSTQATLDYTSAADFAEKVRTQVAASAVIAALFVNSPLAGGQVTGFQSQRGQ